MPTPKKTVTLWCFRAKMHDDDVTLQQRLAAALKVSTKVADRKEEVTENTYQFINDHITKEKMTYGVAFTYEKDKAATIMVEDDEAEKVNIEHLVAQSTDDDKRRQFLEGMLYFFSYRNTLLIVQSAGFSTADFEKHLAWLLVNKGKLEAGEMFAIVPQSTKKIAKKLAKEHVKSFDLATPFADSVKIAPGKGQHGKSLAKKVDVAGKGIEWLRALFTKSILSDKELEEAIGANIEVTLSIRYKYSTTDGGHKLIDNLAMALRHEQHVDTVIHLTGGGTITKDELKLTAKLSVSTTNGIINSNILFAMMRDWLMTQIEEGMIEP